MFWVVSGYILWLNIPLIVANMLPVICGRGGHPLDSGKCLRDGRPIFGQTKTVEGLIGGFVLSAILTAVIIGIVVMNGKYDLYWIWGSSQTNMALHIVTLAAGALLGDLTKSFLKRRLNRPSSSAWFPFDQLDAVAGGYLLTYLFDPTWFKLWLIPGNLPTVSFWVLFYLVVHPICSRVGHKIGWKNQPH